MGKLFGVYLKLVKLFGDGEEYGRIKKGFWIVVWELLWYKG